MQAKMTPREFDKKIQELIGQIKDKTAVFLEDTKVKQLKRKQLCQHDLFAFAHNYFPHYITKEFGDIHNEWHQITELDGHISAIAGPRAHGKSVLLAIIKPIWLAIMEQKHFFLFVSESRDLAKERTVQIRCEFLYNKRLQHDWGEQLTYDTGEETDFIIKSGARFLALGYKQPIRGKLHGSYRPDYIVVDDFESHLSNNPKIARKKLEYIREEAFGALPKNSGIVVWLANLTQKESAINYLKKAVQEEKPKSITFRLYKAITNNKPIWPQGYSLADLAKIKDAMGTVGFERHMQMNPIVEGVKFKSKWFQYYKSTPKDINRIVTYCDPSLGEKTSSDYKAIITLAMCGKKYKLLDCWIRKESILVMLAKLYELDQEYETRIFMEQNFWQRVLWDFIPELSKTYGYLLPVTGIENRVKKEQRIESIQPLFEWGWVEFPDYKSEDLGILEEQLLNFPDHPNDDGPDALAGAINSLKNFSYKQEYRSVKSKAGNSLHKLF
jgi:predicted phage terminase large subunit-like protein